MKAGHLIFVVALLQSTCIFCAEEGPQKLEESIQSLIKAFRNHGYNFANEMQLHIPQIIGIARAELHVALGSQNVTKEAEEEFIELGKELTNYSNRFSTALRTFEYDNKTAVSLRKCVDAIKKVARKRSAFLEADEEHSDDLAEDFVTAFEDEVILIPDVLFQSMYNKFHPKQELFLKYAEMSHGHPGETAAFIHGCFQILTQLTILEANYVELKMNSEEVMATFKRKSENRLNRVLHSAVRILQKLQSQDMITMQIEKDQMRLQEKWKSLSHCDFAHKVRLYLSAKYPKYTFFVVSYSVVRGFDKHALTLCVKAFQLFDYQNRNSIIFLIRSHYRKVDFLSWARKVLDKVPAKIKTKKDKALTVLKAIVKESGECQLGIIFVVTMRASVCYKGPPDISLETVRNAEVCNFRLCWLKRTYYPQRVIIAGRSIYERQLM